MNKGQGFITNPPLSIIPPLPDLTEGYQLAGAGVAMLGKGVSTGSQALQSGLQAIGKATEQAYDAIVDATEMTVITQVVAQPCLKERNNIIETLCDKQTLLLTKFAKQWDGFADSFDSVAKGEWATRARQNIKQEAQKLRDI